jgi:hypothetical protein
VGDTVAGAAGTAVPTAGVAKGGWILVGGGRCRAGEVGCHGRYVGLFLLFEM